MGLLRRRRANGASEPAIFAAARASRTAPRYFFVFLRKHMTDSEKIAAPAEQPAASEKPMSAAADAVETPSEPAPEKKPRRPRRKKPAVEQATLELSAPENAVPAQPVEEQSVWAPPAPEAPARKRPAPKQSAAKTARKRNGSAGQRPQGGRLPEPPGGPGIDAARGSRVCQALRRCRGYQGLDCRVIRDRPGGDDRAGDEGAGDLRP